ncbi:hypothetical protein MNBD_NITROSPINAE04-754 [hydrothermal vent metagenome]|uniref:Uncharacterized protein n=1 Tax=hydrothermal vent metagenome TaxID=652676 RepID=A0A3B1CLY1_9ZZZZ
MNSVMPRVPFRVDLVRHLDGKATGSRLGGRDDNVETLRLRFQR